MLNSSEQFADLFWASRLDTGFQAIASIGVAQTFTQFLALVRIGFDVSMRAMIDRAGGARNIRLANHVLFHALHLTGMYSIAMLLIAVLGTHFFLSVVNASDALREKTALSMRTQFIGSATQNFRMSTGSALQAVGEPTVPLRATAASHAG